MNNQVYKIKLQKGDLVAVRSGKYKGKTGKITAVHPKLNKATVEGINVFKRAIKPSRTHPHGGLTEVTKPMWVSKLSVVKSESKKTKKGGK